MVHKHLLHFRSDTVKTNTVGDIEIVSPLLPSVSDLMDGEIAINYAKGNERLCIKNNDDEIVTFLPDHVILSNEKVTSAALNVLNTKTQELEDNQGVAIQKIDDLEQKIIDDEQTIAVSLNDLNNKIDDTKGLLSEDIEEALSTIDVTKEETKNYTDEKVDDLKGEVIKNEKVISASLNDLNNKVTELMQTVAQLQEIINRKADSADIDDNEEVVSSALNDLNSRLIIVENIINN